MDYNTFVNNIQKSSFTVRKLDFAFNQADTRCWSVLLNPDTNRIIVTYNVNRYELGTQYFDIFYSEGILEDVEVEDIYDTLEVINNKYPTIVESNE